MKAGTGSTDNPIFVCGLSDRCQPLRAVLGLQAPGVDTPTRDGGSTGGRAGFDFSRIEALLMSSSGNATSMNFFEALISVMVLSVVPCLPVDGGRQMCWSNRGDNGRFSACNDDEVLNKGKVIEVFVERQRMQGDTIK